LTANHRWFFVACAASVIVGLILRVLGARGDLWADEIWSLDLAQMAQTPWALFTLRTDNNHQLNSLVIYLLRESHGMFVLRVHSIIAGVGTIILAGVFARRWGRPAAIFTMMIVACSFVLVHYGSEARGYSMLVLFFLASALVLERGLARPSWKTAVLFWMCCGLGVLAHSLFVQGYAALVVWTAWRLIARPRAKNVPANSPAQRGSAARENPSRGSLAKRTLVFATYHVVPMCTIAVLYMTFMRHLGVMGAATSPAWEMICQTASFTLGMPLSDGWDVAALILCAVLLASTTSLLMRAGDDRWVLLLTATVISPGLLVLFSSPDFLLARYFIIPITMTQVTVGFLLGRLWAGNMRARLCSLLVVGGFLLGNAMYTLELLENGRGQYSAALRYIGEHSPGLMVRIGGDHDRRQSTIIRFFGPRELVDRRIEYVSAKLLATTSPEWVLMHTWGDEPSAGQSVTYDKVHVYELRATFPASPLGGWNCLVYQRIGPETLPASGPELR
jgi:hypothetical protein